MVAGPLSVPLGIHPWSTSCVPAGWRRSSDRGEATRAQDEWPVVTDQGESSAQLWVMPVPPPERQSTGYLGCVALEVDGARDQWASRVCFGPEIGLF